MCLPGLDVIFSLAAPAVDILIEHTGVAGVEIGDDEACVGPVRASFDAGDDAFDAAPARGPVEELLEAARLAVFRRGIEARFRAGLKISDMPAQCRGWGDTRNARVLYEDVYCRRGQAENHIKSWKTHLAADRTSCSKATANQLRLFLHAGAYWLMWGLRVSMPKRSMWRVAQFDTLRLRLIKIAARVVEMKTMIVVHLPTSCPAQDILRLVLGSIPRLVT